MNNLNQIQPVSSEENSTTQQLKRFSVAEQHCYDCFAGQFKGEKALYVMRRHWVIHAENILITFLSLLILIVVSTVATQTVLVNVSVPGRLLLVIMCTLYIMLFAFIRWVDYHLSMVILTDQRLVWIKQRNLFSRTIVETLLSQVQDVRAEIHGFLPTVLHYGEVIVETAKAKITFSRIPRPSLLAGYILKLVAKNKARQATDTQNQNTGDNPLDLSKK